MKSFLSILILMSITISCSKLVEGVNDDPNNLTNSTFGTILTGSQVGNILLQSGETARRASIFSGQYTGIDRQHLGFSEYSITTSDFDALWNDGYVDALRNAIVAEQAIADNGLSGVSLGITHVLKAQVFGTMASLYGDIPFKEAGNIQITNPAFEKQKEVYAQVQNLLDNAISNLQMGTDLPISGADLYFNGNAKAWIENAYTLKARFFMHTKEYSKAFEAAGKGISSMDNAMYGPHGTAADNSNLSYQFFFVEVRQADLVVSDFMTSLIQPGTANPIPANYRGNSKTDETARFNYYFATTSVGVQPNTSNGIAAQDAPSTLVSYQENLLILAESGFRSLGFSTGLAGLNTFRSFMANGGYLANANLTQIKYDAYDASDFNAGGIENTDNVNPEDALLREILQERYVTLFGQIEPFNDTRRTEDETVVRVPVQPNNGAMLPQRFLYPQSEIDRNNKIPNPIPNFFDRTPVNQ
tara:strand:- start:23128 stop:24546 length:1419 start_codon:yes stop_codon:yes gene_type:complete